MHRNRIPNVFYTAEEVQDTLKLRSKPLALQHCLDSDDQICRNAGLKYVTQRPGRKCTFHVIRVFMDCHKYDFCSTSPIAQSRCDLDPIEKRHRNVEYDHIGIGTRSSV